ITWVKCFEEECENERPLLDRSLVEAAQAEERYQKIHDHWPPDEGEVQVAPVNEDGTTTVVAALKDECERCGSPRNEQHYCTDITCPFSDHQPECPVGWARHPERDPRPHDDEW